jgi:serine/threonine protein kinase
VGNHPNFISVLGRIVNAPNNQQGLVLPLLDSSPSAYQILGNPPSFTTCTRDTFPDGTQFSFERIFKVLWGISSAAAHLHNPLPGVRNRGIMHGDLYAHNILVHQGDGHALLTDFGAASFKPVINASRGDATAPAVTPEQEQSLRLEQIEVRAFGCLVVDLLDHADAASLPALDPSALPIPPLRSAALVDAPEILACLLSAPLTPPVSPHSAARAAAAAGQNAGMDSAAAMEALHLGVHSNLHLLLRRLCAVCCNPVVKERPTFEVIYSVLAHFQAANAAHCEWLREC